MAEDHDEPGCEARRRELDAAHLRRRDDVPRNANHEQVAEALVEHELSRHPGIGAPEDDRERLLLRRELDALRATHERVAAADVRRESEVSFPQPPERFLCRHCLGSTSAWYTSVGNFAATPLRSGSI